MLSEISYYSNFLCLCFSLSMYDVEKVCISVSFRNSVFYILDLSLTNYYFFSVRRRRPGARATLSPTSPNILIDGRLSNESDEVRCFEKQRQEHKLGIMLIAVSVMFIVCQSFKMIPDLYEVMFCSDKTLPCITTPFVKTCLNLSHLLVTK